MAKKKNDQGFIADLLSKLKASYSEDPKKPSKKTKEEESTADEAFQAQLRQMLGQADPPKKVSKSKKQKQSVKNEPVIEEPIIEEPTVEEPIVEVPVIEEPVIEEPVIEEPIVEEPIVEEPIIEETVIEEPIIEEPIIEEPVIEEPVVEEPKPPLQEHIRYTPTVDVDQLVGIPPVEGQLKMDLPSHAPAEPVDTKPTASVPAVDPIGKDTIVIRPAKKTGSSKQIVITPPGAKKAPPKPIVSTQAADRPASKPIRIGKEATVPMSTQNEKKAKTGAAPSVKQITIQPPTPAVREQKPTVESAPKKPSPAAPKKTVTRTVIKKAMPSRPHILPPKKDEKPRRVAPVSDKLDQVLEGDLSATLFSGDAKKRQTPIDPHSSVPLVDQIREATGLDENDLQMLFAMGYESELASLIGARNLTYLKSEFLKQEAKEGGNRYPGTFGYRGGEYTGENAASVVAAHAKDGKKLARRGIFTALCTFLLLFADLPVLLGGYADTLNTISPSILPLCAMLLFAGSCAFSFTRIKQSITGFADFSPTHYTPIAVLAFFVFLCDILGLFLPSLRPALPINLAAAVLLLSTVLCDLLIWSDQMRSFRILSTEGKKTVLAKTRGYKRKMRLDDRIVQILNDSEGKNLYRVAQTDRVCGFFHRNGGTNAAARPMNILIVLSLSLSVFGSIATAVFTGGNPTASLQVLILLLLLTTPLSAVFALIYPRFYTNRLLASYRCTLVGDESVEEYSCRKTLIFEDTDLFATEKCSEINLTEGADLWPDLRLASALFQKIGHTLSPMASVSGGEHLTVNLLRISENGVEATVDNRYLLAGDERFLNRAGIDIPEDCRRRAMRRTENVGSMYVAVDGVLKLSYEIEYTTRPSFESVVESLAACDTEVAIRSYDPNISQSFVEGMRAAGKPPVYVLKPVHARDDDAIPLTDSGAVSLEDPEKIVSVVHGASAVKKARTLLLRLQVIASILAGVGVGALVFFDMLSYMTVPLVLLWQGLWLVVSLIATHTEVNSEKLRLLK